MFVFLAQWGVFSTRFVLTVVFITMQPSTTHLPLLLPNISFNPDPTVRDYRQVLDFRLSVGPVKFVR